MERRQEWPTVSMDEALVVLEGEQEEMVTGRRRGARREKEKEKEERGARERERPGQLGDEVEEERGEG